MKKQILSLSLFLFFGIGLCAQPKAVGEPRVIAKTNESLTRPAWSHDGTKLLFTSSESGALWEVSATGENLRKASCKASCKAAQLKATICSNALLQQMIDDPVNVASKVAGLQSLSEFMIFNPALSPTGDKIVFEASRGKGMYVCNADGSDLRSLGQKAGRASWTSDGKYVVVMVEGNDGHRITKGELMSINVETGVRSVLLSSDKYIALNPTVSPDGKQVAFECLNEGAIYVIDIK